MSQQSPIRVVLLLASCLMIGIAGRHAAAADKDGSAKGETAATAPQPAKASPGMLTPEREAAAIQFVREHHPELVDLLKGLKETNAAQYQTAVRQLFQTSERLAKIHETDPPRYELELNLWKIKSRIQLLAARASMSRDPQTESQLRAALAEQAQVQLQEMQMDRDRVAERLKKLDASIEHFKNNRPRNIENQLNALMREIDRSRQSAKSAATAANTAKQDRPADQTNATPTVPATPPSAVNVRP